MPIENHTLADRLTRLAKDMEGLDAASCLSLLDERITREADTAFRMHLLITKAQVLNEEAITDEAVLLLEQCSRSPFADESVPYFAAEALATGQRHAEAERFLVLAEKRMEETGSAYYGNCIHLLHAYCAAKLGDFSCAGDYLARVTDREESLFWLRIRPQVSVARVEELINGKSPDEAQLAKSSG